MDNQKLQKQIKSRQEFYIVANKDSGDGLYYLLSGDPHETRDDAMTAAKKSLDEVKDWRNSSSPPLDIPAQTRRVLRCTVCEEITEEL